MFHIPLAFFNLGPWEIALIALFALLMFGGKRLPQLARDMGEGIREFRKSLSQSSEEPNPPSAPEPPQQIQAPVEVSKAQASSKKKRNAKS